MARPSRSSDQSSRRLARDPRVAQLELEESMVVRALSISQEAAGTQQIFKGTATSPRKATHWTVCTSMQLITRWCLQHTPAPLISQVVQLPSTPCKEAITTSQWWTSCTKSRSVIWESLSCNSCRGLSNQRPSGGVIHLRKVTSSWWGGRVTHLCTSPLQFTTSFTNKLIREAENAREITRLECLARLLILSSDGITDPSGKC